MGTSEPSPIRTPEPGRPPRETPTPILREIAEGLRAVREHAVVFPIALRSILAHVAGALARPVWTVIPYEAEWRWMRDRADTPWYPTMRLFRQPAPGDWPGIVRAVADALADFNP